MAYITQKNYLITYFEIIFIILDVTQIMCTRLFLPNYFFFQLTPVLKCFGLGFALRGDASLRQVKMAPLLIVHKL